MKHPQPILLSILLTLALALPNAFAGGAGPGGGDRCEKRFDEVTGYLRKWIDGGGPKGFDFKGTNSSPEDYANRMKEEMKSYQVVCLKAGQEFTSPRGAKYKVEVANSPKECINFVEDGKRYILCDLERFYSSFKDPDNDPGQFYMVHHEFASLARLEPHDGPKSTYRFSERINAFLDKKLMYYLAITPKKQDVGVRLSKLEKPQDSSRYDGYQRCNVVTKTVRGYDDKGKLRLELTEKSCANQQGRIYSLKLVSEDGHAFETSGLEGIPDGLRGLGREFNEYAVMLQGLFYRLRNTDCAIVNVSPEGKVTGDSACRFSRLEEEEPQAPAENATAV